MFRMGSPTCVPEGFAVVERKTVLVVEDNTDELLIYSTLLRFRGYTTLAATGYDEGLRIALEQRPDLAVIDVNLNETDHDGCDLVEALRRDERTRGIPVVVHTAFGDVYQEGLDRIGCSAVVHKPSDPAVLMDAIERLIDHEPGEGEGEGNGGIRR